MRVVVGLTQFVATTLMASITVSIISIVIYHALR